MNYYISGAHSRARTLKEYLRVLEPSMKLAAYLYDNDEANPLEQDGIRVLCAADSDIKSSLHTDYPVYIGTRGIFHSHIKELLENIGFSDIRPVTVELDIRLRNAYVERAFKDKGIPFYKIVAPRLYVVRSYYDKRIEKAEKLSSDEYFLQAGTAAAPREMEEADFYDDGGDDSISERNNQFCELTALYWLWKNTTNEIIGLEHYRRRFTLPADWVSRFTDST